MEFLQSQQQQQQQQQQQEAKRKLGGIMKRQRLQMIANYETFHPQAMACSDPITQQQLPVVPQQHNKTPNKDAVTPIQQQQQQQQQNQSVLATTIASTTTVFTYSLGAIAGSDGIVVFRWDEPQIPILVLSHAASTAGVASSKSAFSINHPNTLLSSSSSSSSPPNMGNMTSLAFSPIQNNNNGASNIYLASTRGSGILIWDVSGHILQPLRARLGMKPAGTNNIISSATITSLAWINPPVGSSSYRYTIIATTTSMAGIWDIRLPPPPPSSSSSTVFDFNSTNIQRPCVRFADASKHLDNSSYLQIACSNITNDSCECAILNASGMVRIYNIRVTTTTTTVVDRPIHQFDACHYTGIGLNFIPLLENDARVARNGWVTWGLDDPNTDPIVKVWMNGSLSSPINENDDDISSEYNLCGQCTTRNVACARVCPYPISNTIVTVAFNDPKQGSNVLDWRTDVWKLQFHNNTLSNSETETVPRGNTDPYDDDDYGLAPDSTLEHVTTFHGPSDDIGSLESILGGKQLMSLQAAEVTLYGGKEDPNGKCGLLLCCLTENGFLTTHTVPEVHIEQHLNSTSIRAPEAKGRTIGTANDKSVKLFPASAELPMVDAASIWGKSLDFSTNVVTPIDRTTFLERSVAFSKGIIDSVSTEITKVTLDNDVSSSYYANTAVSDMSTHGVLTEGVASNSFNVQTNTDYDQTDYSTTSRNAAEIMTKIETDRIPCPRLCGASFSFGVGGITVFNNGGVKRMWNWYEQRDPSRATTVPGLIGEPSLQDLFDDDGDHPVPGSRNAINFPRTLKDLISMTQSSKEAQWGEQEESGALSIEFPVFGNDFFDDDSNASSDSGIENFEDSADKLEYYAQTRDKSTRPSNEVLPVTASAALDMLTPLVKVSNEYLKVSLNNQNFKLANGWRLGDFDISFSQPTMERRDRPKFAPFSPLINPFQDTATSPTNLSTKQVLPSYRSLLPTTTDGKDAVQRGGKSVEHETVHGGEFSVRPNMQESMVFLRKLFTQQHQQEGKTPFPDLLSPPDDSMLPRKTTAVRKLLLVPPPDTRQVLTTSTTHKKVDADALGLGVHTLPADINRDDGELEKIERICLHNATVCEELDETAKMGTWRLVAKLVQSKRKRTGRGFDGWGDSLGVNLIGSLLTFYEFLGDVQMLATLVCVLQNRDQHGMDGVKRRELSLLPADKSPRYDLYIRYYSELLYGWGLLTKRAELVKHRTQIISFDCNQLEGPNTMEGGIAFDVECPRCSGNTHFGFCRPCNDFSFRCSICDNAVRGLFTVCIVCGHGGHVEHVKEWFTQTNKCPTGCGCACKLSAIR